MRLISFELTTIRLIKFQYENISPENLKWKILFSNNYMSSGSAGESVYLDGWKSSKTECESLACDFGSSKSGF